MIVPGSIHIAPVNHPFSWYAIVKEKDTGKQWTYWINGAHWDRAKVATFVATFYRNVDVITIDRCTTMPDRMLQPVPSRHFRFGILEQIEGPGIPIRPLITRKLIPRQIIRR